MYYVRTIIIIEVHRGDRVQAEHRQSTGPDHDLTLRTCVNRELREKNRPEARVGYTAEGKGRNDSELPRDNRREQRVAHRRERRLRSVVEAEAEEVQRSGEALSDNGRQEAAEQHRHSRGKDHW